MGFFSDLWDAATDLFSGVIDAIVTLVDFSTDLGTDIAESIAGVLGITDEDVTLVQSFTNRLIPDPQPFSLIQPVLRSVFDEADLAESLRIAVATGVRTNMKKYSRYGETDYTYGLPSTTIYHTSYQKTEIEVVLAQVTGVACTATNIRIWFPDIDDWARWYLQENVDYTLATNEFTYNTQVVRFISAAIEEPSLDVRITYEYDITIDEEWGETVVILTTDGTEVTTTTGQLETTTITPWSTTVDTVYDTPVITEQPGDGSNDGTTFNVLATDSNTTTDNTDIVDYLVTAPLDEVYYVVHYELDSAPGDIILWVYQQSLETYPELVLVESGSDPTQMLPIIPLRVNKVNIDADTGSPEYLTSKSLLKKISLNLDDYLEQLVSNPDIAEITDSFILFAMNIYTQTEHGMTYWHNFFDVMRNYSYVDKAEYDATPVDTNRPCNYIKVSEQKFNTVLKYNYITQAEITGSIGAVDTVTSVVTVVADDADGNSLSYITLELQTTATVYERIVVHGPMLITAILDGAGKAHMAISKLSTDPVVQTAFSFPVSYFVLDLYNHRDEEALIFESLSMTTYAVQEVHLEWYQTAAFAGILQFIAVVIFFISWGAAAKVSSSLWALAQQMLVQYLIQQVFVLAMEAAGDNEAAQAAVIIAYIYFSYQASGRDNFSLFDAEDLMMATQLTSNAFNTKFALESQALQEENDAFNIAIEDQMEEIEAANENLDRKNPLDFLAIERILTPNFYEDPDTFYKTKGHSSNPGVLALDQPRDFVQRMLELPILPNSFTQTI